MRDQLHAQQPSTLTRRRRVIALGTFVATLAAVIVVIAATLGGGGDGSPRLSLASLRGHPVRVGPAGHLARPVRQAAAAPGGALGRMLVLGGIDEAGAPVSSIQRLDGAASSRPRIIGHLPSALLGSAAAALADTVYVFGGVNVFGGGGTQLSATIIGVPPAAGGAVRQVGRLPRVVADAAVADLGGTAFVFGGFNGSRELDAVLAWRPGGAAHRTAHLPLPLRFAAAASVGGAVIIAGGLAGGSPSRSILRFDPARHRVTRIGLLPVPLAHAGAGTLGGLVLVIGGRRGGLGSETRAIYAIDPASGAARFAGALPTALADLAVATVGDRILVAGGVNRRGKVQRGVLDLRLPVSS